MEMERGEMMWLFVGLFLARQFDKNFHLVHYIKFANQQLKN